MNGGFYSLPWYPPVLPFESKANDLKYINDHLLYSPPTVLYNLTEVPTTTSSS
jgi:hypothetical protein